MDTITINKKEYDELLEDKRRKVDFGEEKKGKKIDRSSFGIWKNRFGKRSSVAYINRMRKSWR